MQATSPPLKPTKTQFQYPWEHQNTLLNLTHKPIFKKFGVFTLKSSLRTSINLDSSEAKDSSSSSSSATWLPVVMKEAGKVSRYWWDGDKLGLVSVDGGATSFRFGLSLRNFFIPKRVSENYMEYVKWKFLHRIFSSALQVLATQAMFRAIGIGYSRSLPSAAALNWVLKDGLGRLSRCIYTASLASAFDTNLKRVRFSTSVLFTLSIGVELLTPVFPQYFLLLATMANIAKQISLACYLATGSAIHRSFAIADNQGEVSAKAQIQTVCFDNLGLMLAALLNVSFKNHPRLLAGLPFVVYPIFSAVDLFGIYQGLKHVHLQTLTKDRLEIILNSWIECGHVPSPAEASEHEEINFLSSKREELWPIRIGSLNPKGNLPKLPMLAMQSSSREDYYFICIENYFKGFKRTKQRGILLCLREGASTSDIMMGLLQACYIRRNMTLNRRWEAIAETSDVSDLVVEEWFYMVEESKQSCQNDLVSLEDRMSALGWSLKHILLSADEQARYSYVND